MNQLHVYAQLWQHSNAYITGDRESLQQLRDQIDHALTNSVLKDAYLNAFVNDGEGFKLYVMCLSGEEMDALTVPYTDEMAQSQRGLHPHHLLTPQEPPDVPPTTVLQPWDDPLQ